MALQNIATKLHKIIKTEHPSLANRNLQRKFLLGSWTVCPYDSGLLPWKYTTLCKDMKKFCTKINNGD
jgi:hypothetical protein